jgi:indole-3-glycerol phosphate synthase
MTGQRRLSQRISEGDGISLIVPVTDLAAALAAEEAGAEGLLLLADLPGIREATGLPIIVRNPRGDAAGIADGCVLGAADLDDDHDGEIERRYAELSERGLECIVDVSDADALEAALERLDPEIFLLSAIGSEGAEALERVLDLLEDVPAGKLAIADLPVTTREQVVELERAGVDAVIVGASNVSDLVGAPPPEV